LLERGFASDGEKFGGVIERVLNHGLHLIQSHRYVFVLSSSNQRHSLVSTQYFSRIHQSLREIS
jgi:hypothetical protein